ncbi:hypothetical protein ZIOFF_056841 [Zingiber officinale]|uniref:Uncharacterized protein n=1 Tax=Zingiber officinale TaxID=94328 RepID=A0A8J5FP81_ZINOF|nr:hypothetical protein ZIOFF_056841 [Zingiber officinale]
MRESGNESQGVKHNERWKQEEDLLSKAKSSAKKGKEDIYRCQEGSERPRPWHPSNGRPPDCFLARFSDYILVRSLDQVLVRPPDYFLARSSDYILVRSSMGHASRLLLGQVFILHLGQVSRSSTGQASRLLLGQVFRLLPGHVSRPGPKQTFQNPANFARGTHVSTAIKLASVSRNRKHAQWMQRQAVSARHSDDPLSSSRTPLRNGPADPASHEANRDSDLQHQPFNALRPPMQHERAAATKLLERRSRASGPRPGPCVCCMGPGRRLRGAHMGGRFACETMWPPPSRSAGAEGWTRGTSRSLLAALPLARQKKRGGARGVGQVLNDRIAFGVTWACHDHGVAGTWKGRVEWVIEIATESVASGLPPAKAETRHFNRRKMSPAQTVRSRPQNNGDLFGPLPLAVAAIAVPLLSLCMPSPL